jgi:hypothetical protein
MTAPIKLPPNPTELIGTVRTLQDAVEVFRLMKDRLGLTNEFIDDVGGLTKGHADKLLGRSEMKRLGYDTFALLAALTAIEFRVYVDMDAVKRMEKVWEGRARPLFPNGKPGRVSKKLIEMAAPHVAKQMGIAGAAKKMTMLSAEHRSKIARKAAKCRWRKTARAARDQIRKGSQTEKLPKKTAAEFTLGKLS